MANSKLATYKWSGNTDHYNIRDHKIDRITIHHMAGNLTCERCANVLQGHGGSVNYMIDTNGKIGVMIDEQYRAWTSSSRPNDMRAVTIEVANDGGVPDWHVSDKALAATIELCADICKRNGFKLNYTGDTSGNLTMHKWFAATGCPEKYLGGKYPYIAAEVNKRLAAATPKTLDSSGFKKGNKGNGVLALKKLLMLAGASGLDSSGGFGGGTEKVVNALLKKWGYKQNGIAGEKFINKLYKETKK